MTGPEDSSSATRPISVAELLAKNGTIGAPPVSGRRRRRRGNSDAVTVAELTGDIPVVRDDDSHDEIDHPGPTTHARRPNGTTRLAEPVRDDVPSPVSDRVDDQTPEEFDDVETTYWSEPGPRWPESPPQPHRGPGPELSQYPRPARKADRADSERRGQPAGKPEQEACAEWMSPDPLDDYAEIPVDVMDTEVREAEPAAEDSAYVRSYLRGPAEGLFGGKTIEAGERRDGIGELSESEPPESLAVYEDFAEPAEIGEHLDEDVEDSYARPGRIESLLGGGLVVLQSIVAVAFGAGLFIAFEQLWRWNNIVALVLSVLVILGLVVGVRIVRKTEDIASTLIAVAVGALVTLGPLALLQSG